MHYGLENFEEMNLQKKAIEKASNKAGGKFDDVKAKAEDTMVEK